MNFFEEPELARQQRLYELQRMYREHEQAHLNDLSDDISEAASYQPAEHEVSPEFLLRGHAPQQQRLDEHRDVPDRFRDPRPIRPQHIMDMDGSIIAAGVQAGIQGAQGARVGDLRHDSDPRAFQRVDGIFTEMLISSGSWPMRLVASWRFAGTMMTFGVRSTTW